MKRKLPPLAALAMVALIGTGCSNGATENGDTGSGSNAGTGGNNRNITDRDKAVQFAECMRDNGVSEFPDPDASGGLTIDGIVNGSSLDPSTAAWKEAIAACKDLQPPGFTGDGKRSAEEQKAALEFAQCIRDNGVKDFPDPTPDGPLVNVDNGRSIPGLRAAMQTCRDLIRDQLGRQ
jgi:hypothetical protein